MNRRSRREHGPGRAPAQFPLTGRDIRAENGVNGASCHIGASNLIPGFFPRPWGSGSYGVGKVEHGHEGAPEDGSVSRSVCVLAPRRRLWRRTGPGLLTTQVGAGDHPGKDAQPTPDRLSLLGGAGRRSPVRRRPAIGRWSSRQLVHLSAVCRDSSDHGPRKRVCAIETRNKTSHRSAQGCGPLQALFFSASVVQYRGCTGV